MILASAPPVPLILSVFSAVAYALPALLSKRLSLRAAHAIVAMAWLAHGAVLAFGLLGAPPLFGFAPALSVTAWLVAAVYGVESLIYPQLPTRWTLSAIGTVAVLLAYAFPGSAMPASTSVWLPMHLAFGVACYGLFGTAVVHAWFMRHAEKRIRLAKDSHSGLPLLTLERLTYRLVGSGFVLLSATLALGMAFDDAQALPRARQAWLDDPHWQELRRYTEDLMVEKDWFEVLLAQNYVLEGLLYPLVYSEFNDTLNAEYGPLFSLLTRFQREWYAESAKWVDALVKVAVAESPQNQALLSAWSRRWLPRARTALAPLATLAWGAAGEARLAAVEEAWRTRAGKAGITLQG